MRDIATVPYIILDETFLHPTCLSEYIYTFERMPKNCTKTKVEYRTQRWWNLLRSPVWPVQRALGAGLQELQVGFMVSRRDTAKQRNYREYKEKNIRQLLYLGENPRSNQIMRPPGCAWRAHIHIARYAQNQHNKKRIHTCAFAITTKQLKYTKKTSSILPNLGAHTIMCMYMYIYIYS